MSEWNFDMSQAPKGEFELVASIRGGKDIERRVHKPVKIIAADASSDVVTVSYWVPASNRWAMFTEEVPPVAWKPWPSHPGAKL